MDGTETGSGHMATWKRSAEGDFSSGKAWAREHFHGTENIIYPSYAPDVEGLDEEAIRADVRTSVAHGFCSSLPVAIGGDASEYRRMIEIVADEAEGDMLTTVAVSGELEDDVALLEHAAAVGCSQAMMSILPRPGQTEEELYEAYRARIDSTELPIVVYAGFLSAERSHLGPSGVPLRVLDRVADLPSVIAIKLTQPISPSTAYQVADALGDRLILGPVNLELVPFLARNWNVSWTGQWNAESMQSPARPYVVDFIDAVGAGKLSDALAIYAAFESRHQEFYELQAPFISRGAHPWAHLKYHQWCSGGNGGLPRPPAGKLEPDMVLDAETRMSTRKGYEAVGIEPSMDAEEEFIVGRAAYARGVRASDLPATPWWAG
jgi:4-hydroxy-tetrahydrodipicolinate synthase